MSYYDPIIAKAQHKLRKLLRTCLTPEEEREIWRYFLTECPDDRLKATMLKTWIDRFHGPQINRNINVNHNVSSDAADCSLLSADTLARIRDDMRKGITQDQPKAIEADYVVMPHATIPEPADPSSEQLDKLIKVKADIERIKRQLKEAN